MPNNEQKHDNNAEEHGLMELETEIGNNLTITTGQNLTIDKNKRINMNADTNIKRKLNEFSPCFTPPGTIKKHKNCFYE